MGQRVIDTNPSCSSLEAELGKLPEIPETPVGRLCGEDGCCC
jgi:hypothetical protein